jgi:arginyl-tRNA synthetase
MVAVGYRKYGSQEESDKNALMHLYDVYVKISKEYKKDPKVKAEAGEWFKKMEDGDEEVLKEWRGWRELSVKRYQEAYSQLNIEFDVYTGESNVRKDSIEKVITQLENMGLISHREDAMEVDLKKWALEKPIVRKTGSWPTLLPSIFIVANIFTKMELPHT